MNLQEIINRAININVKPASEWQVVAKETSDKNQVIMGYAIPLTVLVAIAYLLGNVIFPHLGLFSIPYSVASAVVQFLVSFLGMFVSAFIINAIASHFDSKTDINATFKWVVYSFTPVWIVNILIGIVPDLSFVGVVGLYSLYLLWTGASPVLGTPEDKKTGFVLISFFITVAVYFIALMVLLSILSSFFWSSFAAGAENILH
jgi:hypothetical protein